MVNASVLLGELDTGNIGVKTSLSKLGSVSVCESLSHQSDDPVTSCHISDLDVKERCGRMHLGSDHTLTQ